jgi:O-antigen/teichoic acid export membrane protein
MRFSRAFVKFSLIREMWVYGIHSFVANVSNMLLYQGAPVLIGHLRPAAFVGYYTFPFRLLQYSVDGISRVGLVTRSNVAEMQAKGDERAVYSMGIFLNRYCLSLFAPLAIFLLVYGTELIRRWMNQEFATHCGPLLPAMVLTTLFAVAGQYNSSSMLFGLSRHDRMAKSMLAEGVLGIIGSWLVLPSHGILGVAWVTGILAVLGRGLYVPWLVCRALKSSFAGYMMGIYARPLLTAIPVMLLLRSVKGAGVTGETWPQLILMGGLTAVGFFVPAFFICASREHRKLMVEWVLSRIFPGKSVAAV